MTRILRAVRTLPALERAGIVDAKLDAEAIRARARQQAEHLREQARTECERLRADAQEAGLEQGSTLIARRMLELDEAHQQRLAELESRVLELGLKAARHLVASELSIRPEAAVAIVRELLAPLRHARRVTICTHPDDCEVLQSALGQAIRTGAIELRSDARIARGGAVVQSDVGTLDARVEVRIEALAKLLSGP